MEKAWLDGELVYSSSTIPFRTDSSLIEKLALHVYHGGSVGDSGFEPKQAQTIWCAAPCMSSGDDLYHHRLRVAHNLQRQMCARDIGARGCRLDNVRVSEGECPP